MAKQTYTSGQVLSAAQMTTLQANDYNQTVSAKVASYTLVAADVGTRITMSNAGATTITVNTGLFAAGDTLILTNIGAGACTITAGTATVSTISSLVLAQYDSGTLYFTSTGVAIFEKYAGPAVAAGGMTQIATGSLSGGTVTISSIAGTYTDLRLIVRDHETQSAQTSFRVRVNSNSATEYFFGTATSTNSSASDGWTITSASPSLSPTSTMILNIYNYASSTRRVGNYYAWSTTNGSVFYNVMGVLAYNNTTAITSVSILAQGGETFDGGTYEVWGIK